MNPLCGELDAYKFVKPGKLNNTQLKLIIEDINKPQKSTIVIDENLNPIKPEFTVNDRKLDSINRMNHPWEKYEDNYLIANYGIMTWNEIGKKLFRSAKSCRRRYKKIKGDF